MKKKGKFALKKTDKEDVLNILRPPRHLRAIRRQKRKSKHART